MSRKVTNIVSVLLSVCLVVLACCGWVFTRQNILTGLRADMGLSDEAARRTLESIVDGCIYIDDSEIPLSSTLGYDVYQTKLALDTVNKLNKVRQEYGLSELKWTDSLNVASMIRAKECSVKWSHTRPNGQDYWTVDSKHVYGENLAYGYETADAAISAWMGSPSHRDNILYSEFKTIALAVYKAEDGNYYWATEFGI